MESIPKDSSSINNNFYKILQVTLNTVSLKKYQLSLSLIHNILTLIIKITYQYKNGGLM